MHKVSDKKSDNDTAGLLGRLFTFWLPQPFVIAVLLTFLVFLLAFFITRGESTAVDYCADLIRFWGEGVWSTAGLEFAMQMMLMLVLGHILALSPPVSKLIDVIIADCYSTSKTAFRIALFTMLLSLFNWGLGLVFGAILARRAAERATTLNLPLNYGLVGAAGYSGMMIWHAGLSGSALLKVSEPGALKQMMTGSGMTQEQIALIPNSIPMESTMFSSMNLMAVLACLIILPIIVSVLGKRQQGTLLNVKAPSKIGSDNMNRIKSPAALMDSGRWVLILTSVPVILLAFIQVSDFMENQSGLGFITPNFVNTFLLGMALLFHQRPSSFLSALDEAIGGCSGILIQFPLYFGIMGVMKGSGLITEISYAFSSISNPDTFPVLSYFSAGVTNIMVPSGGGQWAVQGPILIQGATDLGVPLEKTVLSLAYGDQITNMMQPFWALPLLGITGLKARQILPYSLVLMITGGVIFTMALWWG